MRYEIRSIEPVLGDRDVLLEIHYWYEEPDGRDRPQRAADFVEHHLIVGIPKPRRQPVRNKLGQLLGADGIYVIAWVEVDGDWRELVPADDDPAFQWHALDEDRPEDVIESVADRRARDVEQFDLRGMRDLYRPEDKPARSERLGNVANRAAVRALERRRKQV